jgi:hypothetical protein
MSEHHDAVLYEIRQSVQETANRAQRIAGPINCDVASLHFGLGLVVCRGFLEKEMHKKCDLPAPGKFPKRMKNISGKPVIRTIDFWQYKFDPKNDWYGWQELTNFFRLAEGFSENGGTLNGKGAKVKAFLKQLGAGTVMGRKKKAIDPYYDIDDEGKVKLQSEALGRFTSLVGELVHLAEKHLRRRNKKRSK